VSGAWLGVLAAARYPAGWADYPAAAPVWRTVHDWLSGAATHGQ
jgi:hypothetical protein